MTGEQDRKGMVKITVMTLAQRRVATTPMREPGVGQKISKEVWVYPERYDRTNGKGAWKRHKEQLRQESAARTAAWQKLSPQQQLARLDAANLPATKQRARIAAAIAKGQEKTPEEKQVAKKARTEEAAKKLIEQRSKKTGVV